MRINKTISTICGGTLLIASAANGGPTLTTLVNFSGGNGDWPQAGLVADAAGNMYGTTYEGGPINEDSTGTVFEIATGTHAFSTLATNVGYPVSSLAVDSSGNIFGTTEGGSGVGNSTIFKIPAGTNTLNRLATFSGVVVPSGVVADAAGNLYGTTEQGGSNGGSVFELPVGSSTINTLVNFSLLTGVDPSPYAGLTPDGAGNFYGVTTGGGAYFGGTVFKISATGAFSVVANLEYVATGTLVDGVHPLLAK